MTTSKLAQYWKIIGAIAGALPALIAYAIAHQLVIGAAGHDLTTIAPYATMACALIGVWRAPRNADGTTLAQQIEQRLAESAAILKAAQASGVTFPTFLSTVEQTFTPTGGALPPAPANVGAPAPETIGLPAPDNTNPAAGYITPQVCISAFLIFVAALGSLLRQPAVIGLAICVVAVVLAVHHGWWRGLARKVTTHSAHPTQAVHVREPALTTRAK